MADPIIFQHYEVLVREDGSPWELGRGAMGVTYKALDTNLRVPVALKIIHPPAAEQRAGRAPLRPRSACRGPACAIRNIAAVYHLGQDRDTWFYAMEFIAGETVEALVKRRRSAARGGRCSRSPRRWPAPCRPRSSTGSCIATSSRRTSCSCAKTTDWLVKLIDFGLARTFAEPTDDDLAGLTVSGFVGTPFFSSPEQLEQQRARYPLRHLLARRHALVPRDGPGAVHRLRGERASRNISRRPRRFDQLATFRPRADAASAFTDAGKVAGRTPAKLGGTSAGDRSCRAQPTPTATVASPPRLRP